VTQILTAGMDTKGWRTLDAGDNKRYYISPDGTKFCETKKEVPDVEIHFLETWRAPLALKRVAT